MKTNKVFLPNNTNCKIAVIGLGYVGLPLAVQFASTRVCKLTSQLLTRQIYGYDVKSSRIKSLKNFRDLNHECSEQTLSNCSHSITYTDCIDDISQCNVFIITVPTPVDKANIPDLSTLKSAFSSIGNLISSRKSIYNTSVPVIIVESTVYPGATRELAESVLGKKFQLNLNQNYFLGFSPERINPGDKSRTISNVVKVTSGSNEVASKWIDQLYGSIIDAGTHLASSIEVAEAAKIIENTQRDLNIALMNELTIIFDRLNIDTREVLAASSTKWNFIPFYPGLVGGHCISVDPYYLTHKSVIEGYTPQIVLAGRRINDGMASWVANKFIRHLFSANNISLPVSVLILGFTFKPDCNDIRNTKVFDLVSSLDEYGIHQTIYDPIACPDEVKKSYDLTIASSIGNNEDISYSAVIVCVSHKEFKQYTTNKWESLINTDGFIFDLTGIVPYALNPLRL